MIAIGSDHGGFELKEKLMEHLSERGLEYKDFGTYSSASCDYPVYAKAVANGPAQEAQPCAHPLYSAAGARVGDARHLLRDAEVRRHHEGWRLGRAADP